MGETFPPSEVISLELSHRVSDFWLIARRRCERHRHPWIPVRRGAFFSRELTVEGKREREEERGSCPCFLIILKRSLERVASYVWIEEIDGRGWARTCSRLFVAGVSRAIRWTVSCLLDIPWCVLWFLFSFGSGREMRWENRDRERGGKG